MTLPKDLKCPKCGSEDIDIAGEFIYCVECGAMPNRAGYEYRETAIRGFRRWQRREAGKEKVK